MTLKIIPPEDVSEEKQNSDIEIRKVYNFVVDYFQKTNPEPTTELVHKNGFELIVATILSAQTPDSRVNQVTHYLFKKYPTNEILAKATPEDVYNYIGSIPFGHKKSIQLVGMAKKLDKEYNGEIPKDRNELQKLPGVGRKTANVILATLFKLPVIAVDTHVMRVSERIGLVTDVSTPLEIEEQLMLHTPKEAMHKMSHWLILHGRYVCKARTPLCSQCELSDVCRYYNTN